MVEIAGLDLRHVENAVDDRQEMLAGTVDQRGIFVAALAVEQKLVFLHQHIGEADDGIERRAQFVAHGGEEAAFGVIGALRFGMRVELRLLQALAFGDVAQHRDDFAAIVAVIGVDSSNGRQRISIQMNSGLGGRRRRAVAPHAKLDGIRFAERRGIAERGQR